MKCFLEGLPGLLLIYNEQPSFVRQKQALILSISCFPEMHVPLNSVYPAGLFSRAFFTESAGPRSSLANLIIPNP